MAQVYCEQTALELHRDPPVSVPARHVHSAHGHVETFHHID